MPGKASKEKGKRTEALSLYQAMDQAIRDSAGSGNLPAVFHRRSHRPWLVIMRLDDWIHLYHSWCKYNE